MRNHVYPPHRSYGVEVQPNTVPIDLYLRLSAYHKDGADAIERQRLDLTRQLAAEGGWTITGEFIDNDSASSSARRTRKGWAALDHAIATGETTAVAFWKLDRISRVAIKTIGWLAMCQEQGVTLVSHQDSRSELNTASGSAKLVTGVKSLLAETETDTMSERIKAAKRHGAEAGFTRGGAPPFGWTSGPRVVDQYGRSGVRLVPHPYEHQALKDAVAIVIDGGSLTDVSRHFRLKFGIVTASGRLYPAGNIARFLESPLLLGYRTAGAPERGRGVRINWMDHVVKDSNGDPIISQEPVCDPVVWGQLQVALQERLRRQGSQKRHSWELTGMLMCSCGHALYGAAWKAIDGRCVLNYTCHSNRIYGPGTCAALTRIPALETEAYVYGWLLEYLDPTRLASAENKRVLAGAKGPIGRLRAEIEATEAELTELQRQRSSEDAENPFKAVLAGMIDVAQSRIAVLRTNLEKMTKVDLPSGAELARLWPGMTLDEKRSLIRSVIDHIDIKLDSEIPAARRLKIVPKPNFG